MFSKKILELLKITFCLLLVLIFVIGCGEQPTTKKKKKVVKKVVIVEEDETDITDNTSSDEDGMPTFSFDTDTREKRELYKEAEMVETVKAEVIEPDYCLKAYNWDGPSGYVIIYTKGDRTNRNSALKLQKYFEMVAGVKLKVSDDSVAVSAKEILIGDTNRRKTALKTNMYSVVLADDDLIFEGGHSMMVEEAVKWFVASKYEKGKVNLISGGCKTFTTSAKNGYKYVWGDEFGGTALDMDKWCFKNRMAGTNMMPALSDSSVVNVNEGLLKMTAVRYYNASRPMAQYATNLTLSSEESMSFKYGYLEMRGMVPFNRGAWPGYWMVSDGAIGNNNSQADYFAEVDIFEVFSSVNTVTPNIHKWYKDGEWSQYNGGHIDGKVSSKYVYEDYDNLRYEYHVYGFEWTPEKMTMSVDGKDYMTYDITYNFDGKSDMSGFHDNLFLLFSNYMYVPDYGGTSSNTEVNNKDLPFEFFVDYVRLYQKTGEGALNFAN